MVFSCLSTKAPYGEHWSFQTSLYVISKFFPYVEVQSDYKISLRGRGSKGKGKGKGLIGREIARFSSVRNPFHLPFQRPTKQAITKLIKLARNSLFKSF